MKKLIQDFLYEEESHKIGDACKEAWKQFGNSFKESLIIDAPFYDKRALMAFNRA